MDHKYHIYYKNRVGPDELFICTSPAEVSFNHVSTPLWIGQRCSKGNMRKWQR